MPTVPIRGVQGDPEVPRALGGACEVAARRRSARGSREAGSTRNAGARWREKEIERI